MDRKHFVERGEVKCDFLRNYRLIRRWACREYDLLEADLELLLYLDPLIYFTRKDFMTGTLYYKWDKKRFYRLLKNEWIVKIAGREDNGHKGHNRYKVSLTGKLLIQRMYRMCGGLEDMPESARRNKMFKKKSYSDKMYSLAIKKMNRQ